MEYVTFYIFRWPFIQLYTRDWGLQICIWWIYEHKDTMKTIVSLNKLKCPSHDESDFKLKKIFKKFWKPVADPIKLFSSMSKIFFVFRC